MTSLEPSSHPLEALVATAFAALIDRGAVDVVAGDQDDAWEVQADQWTLAMEGWPLTFAFLAIDDEPAGRGEMLASLDAALGPDDLAAIQALDHRLDGSLRQALLRSNDALSSMLATQFVGNSSDL